MTFCMLSAFGLSACENMTVLDNPLQSNYSGPKFTIQVGKFPNQTGTNNIVSITKTIAFGNPRNSSEVQMTRNIFGTGLANQMQTALVQTRVFNVVANGASRYALSGAITEYKPDKSVFTINRKPTAPSTSTNPFDAILGDLKKTMDNVRIKNTHVAMTVNLHDKRTGYIIDSVTIEGNSGGLTLDGKTKGGKREVTAAIKASLQKALRDGSTKAARWAANVVRKQQNVKTAALAKPKQMNQ